MIRKTDVRFLLVLFLSCLYAGTSPAQQQNSVRQDKIFTSRQQQAEALYLEALLFIAPEQLPPSLRELDVPVKSATALSYSIRSLVDQFTHSQRELLQPFLSRPVLDTSLVSPSGRFRIHYDTSGNGAVSPLDEDNSGLPDYVEEVAAIFDHVYETEVNIVGLEPPPPDGGRDGPEYDIYISNLPNVYGWTNFETKTSDDPVRWISYMEIDNNYDHTPTRGLDGVRVTAAHEFFHMIQLGYIARDDDNDNRLDDIYLMEAGSTWMEDVVYDSINDYLNYLYSFFNAADRRFNYTAGLHMYGLCLWFHYLEANFSGPRIVSDVWDELVTAPGMEALDNVLSRNNSSFSAELANFYVWNYRTGTRADTVNYYEEGHLYPEVQITSQNGLRLDTTITARMAPTTARYYSLSRRDGYSLTLIPVNSGWQSAANTENEIEMTVVHGPPRNSYVDAGSDFQVTVTADSMETWGCFSVTEPAFVHTDLISAGPDTIETSEELLVYPNPFLPDKHFFMTVMFPSPSQHRRRVMIYNTSGQKILEGEAPSLSPSFRWDGKDAQGRSVASGVYLIVVIDENDDVSRARMMVVR